MFKTRKSTDQGAQRSLRPSFWRSDAPVAQPPSDAETIRFHRSSVLRHSSQPVPAPTAVDSRAIGGRTQAVPVTTRPATTATPSVVSSYPAHSQPQFNVVRSSVDPRNAVATTSSPAPHAGLTSPPSQSINVPRANDTLISSKPAPTDVPSHRTSASLNSLHTASTSRSSFERISAENLQGSWGSNTFTTAPSSNAPRSTESLVRIPVAHDGSKDSAPKEQRQRRESARYPLVETSDSQRTPAAAHAESTQVGEQASNALPLPNSDYESPVRARSLRRSKGQINGGTGSSNSIRDATAATGRQSPAPATQTSPSPPSAQPTHRRSRSEMIPEIAYLPPQHSTGSADRHTLLARVMSASTPSKMSKGTSTASARAMSAPSTHQPRVYSSSQEANPNMTKLKQTTIPRLSTGSIAASSPSIEQERQLAALHSPTSLQATAESIPPWKYSNTPVMTSGPTYSSLTSQVMSPNRASVASPRTLVYGSHHASELPAILPSQQRSALSSAGSTVGKPYVEEDTNSSFSTATPGSPASHTVRALFSSFTSRPSRQPARASSLSNPPITAPEVDSPRLANLASGLLTPPPLPPQSTRPDAPQQSYTQLQSQFQHPTSPRHATPDFTKPNSSKAATPSRRDETASPVSGLRSPSAAQPSILQNYGLDRESASANPRSPSANVHRALMGTPFHGERTLMSDSEYTVTTSISVTRSTVVQTAHAQPSSGPLPHALERLTASSMRKERPTPAIQSASGRVTPQSQGYPAQLPYPPQQSQSGGIFNMFRPKSPARPFPTIERSASPAPAPPPSKTPPPRAATASPRRFVAWSIPILRHKPKKSISGVSGASMEAVIGGTQFGVTNEIAMSSQGSLLPSRTPDPLTAQQHGGISENNKRLAAVMDTKGRVRMVDEDEFDDAGDDGVQSDEPPFEDRMYAVQQWNNNREQDWKASGKSRRQRPGVSFDLPASESERDDGGMTMVSAVPAAGRILRYGRPQAHARQLSDVESTVY